MQELEKTLLKETEQLVNMHYEDDSVKTIILRNLRDIRKHMSGKDTGVPTNDGWIPADEVLPEDDVEVLVTYANIDDGQYTGIAITTYGYAYLGGNKLDFKEWRSPFAYFRSDYKVIAWRPLPEPYRPKKESEGSRRLREREEFFKG